MNPESRWRVKVRSTLPVVATNWLVPTRHRMRSSRPGRRTPPIDCWPSLMMSTMTCSASLNGLPSSDRGGSLPSPNSLMVRHWAAACFSVRYWSTLRVVWVAAGSPKS